MQAEGISWSLIKTRRNGLGKSAGGQEQSEMSWLTWLVSPNPSKGQDKDATCCKAAMLPFPHMLPASTCKFKCAVQIAQPCLCTSNFIAWSLVLHC